MSNYIPGKWGGSRRHSGRSTGGIREAKRILTNAVLTGDVDKAADLVTTMILEGSGSEVLKLWYQSSSVTLEREKEKSNKEKSIYNQAIQKSSKLS